MFGQEDDADLARQFREGVARAAQKLRDPSFVLRARCRHSSELVSISAEWRKKYGPGYAARKQDPMAASIIEFECALRGDAALQIGSTGPPKNLEYIRGRNRSYVFALQRPSGSDRNALQFVERPGRNPAVDEQIATIEAEVRGSALAGYYLWDMALADLAPSDAFQIRRVGRVESENGSLVRVEFEYLRRNAKDEPDTTFSDGYMMLDPDNEWIVREYGASVHTHFNDTRSIVHVTLDVGQRIANMPIVAGLERTTTFPDDPGTTMRGVSTVEVDQRAIQEQEFYLSHYGLPEPKFERGGYGVWLLYLAGGAACLAGAYALRRRRFGVSGPNQSS